MPLLLYNLVTTLEHHIIEQQNGGVKVTSTSAGVDIVAVTEAWQIILEVCTIENYQLFLHLKTDKTGREAALYCRSFPPSSRLHVNPPQDAETLWIRLTHPQSPSPHNPHHHLCSHCV